VKNAKHAQRRRNTKNRTHNPMYQRDLNNAFAAVTDREYRTPMGTIVEAALLAQQLPSNPQIQRLQYLIQRTLVQLDGKHPVSSTRNLPSRSERHSETALISRSSRGGPGAGGMKTASETRATRSHAVTMNKNYNNLLVTSMVQGIKAKIHSRPAFTTLPQSTLGRRSMKAATCGVLSKQGEGPIPARTTVMTTATASLPSPPTSPTNPIPRSSNQSGSPSTMVSRTHANGFDATP
jgi:hypothetical protein